MKIAKRLIAVVGLSLGLAAFYVGTTVQAATTLYSGGQIVELSQDALVCPDGVTPDSPDCEPLQPPGQYPNPNGGAPIQNANDCDRAAAKPKGNAQECQKCCGHLTNGPIAALGCVKREC
jgi:hypothetical protein